MSFEAPFSRVGSIAIEKHITNVLSFTRGPQFEARRKIRRQILQAVHRKTGLTIEQGEFEFLGEQSFGKICIGQRVSLQFVASGLDDLDLELTPRKGGPALAQHRIGLRQRESAASSGNDQR